MVPAQLVNRPAANWAERWDTSAPAGLGQAGAFLPDPQQETGPSEAMAPRLAGGHPPSAALAMGWPDHLFGCLHPKASGRNQAGNVRGREMGELGRAQRGDKVGGSALKKLWSVSFLCNI